MWSYIQLLSAAYIEPLRSKTPSNFMPTPHEMDDRQSQSPARSIHIGLETSPSMYRSIFQNIHSQKHHGTQEKRFAYLDDFWRNEEEILDDSADASLDRFVVLLNWTLLSVSPSRRSGILFLITHDIVPQL
jgi:hypothetical protein